MSAAVGDEENLAAAVGTASPAQAPLSSFHTASLLRSIPLLPTEPSSTADPPFFKGVKWSPDATCLLTGAEDHVMRLYEVQSLMADPSSSSSPRLSRPVSARRRVCVRQLLVPCDALVPACHLRLPHHLQGPSHPAVGRIHRRLQGPPPPLSHLTRPLCCVAHCPPARLCVVAQCSYVGMNNADEPTAALSVCFSPSGSAVSPYTLRHPHSVSSAPLPPCAAAVSPLCSDVVYAGYEGCIRIFDTATPGPRLHPPPSPHSSHPLIPSPLWPARTHLLSGVLPYHPGRWLLLRSSRPLLPHLPPLPRTHPHPPRRRLLPQSGRPPAVRWGQGAGGAG